MTRRVRLLVAALAVAAVVAGIAFWSARSTGPAPITPQSLTIPVGPEANGDPVSLDADLYLPAGDAAAPAVLLAHGFGGDKSDLRADAQRLAADGYVVLAYTARGFGDSGGLIHLMDPNFEVADARALTNTLAAQPRVQRDGPDDPRVAVMGGSYGGALALMAAGADPRIDSVVAMITWNDLATAFFPNGAAAQPETTAATPGPFKQLWAAAFLLGGQGRDGQGGGSGRDQGACGRFDPTLCRLFVAAAETGVPDDELLALLRKHSPAPTLDRITAPVYLVQGMTDTLFGIDQADATADALLARDVPVAVRWTNGGHDGTGTDASPTGGSSAAIAERDEVSTSIDTWLGGTLRQHLSSTSTTSLPVAGFTYAVRPRRGQDQARGFSLPSYADAPAPSATGPGALALHAVGPTRLINPPGALPAAITSVPGGPDFTDAPGYSLAALPGQHVAFETDPLIRSLVAVGAPRLDVDLTSTGSSVTLFASLWQVQGESARLIRPLTAPLRVATEPGQRTPISITLPAATWELQAGSTWRILLSATDAAYRGDIRARSDAIALADPVLRVPVASGTPVAGPSLIDAETRWVLIATGLLLLTLAGLALSRRRRHEDAGDPTAYDGPALEVRGLTKFYGDGHRAVDDVSWRAERGQVVGLLGPNGAGKTTTLRMAVGLIHPDGGRTDILGRLVTPGAPVLRHVGALIEGPGFVPHLSGRENLRAFWAATGRPQQDAAMDEAIAVAALGGALDRPVKSYSHGMRQRLGIAQAMLGRPDVLILDEPTNGLDPPQIAGLRPILRRYAESGRTVVVSSHLLAEVEMTCTHVVVMHAGRVVAAGAVGDLSGGRRLEEVFLETIAGIDRGDGGGSADANTDETHESRTERLRQIRPR